MRNILVILGILVMISCILLVGCQETKKTTTSTPTITWAISQDSIVIKTTSEGVYYNSDSTTNNIQFYDVYTDIYYYVDEDLGITNSLKNLSMKKIEVGDEITNFNMYHNYSLIWKPTNMEIGKISFEILSSPIVTFGQYDENVNVTLSVTISNPNVPWADIICTLRDITGGIEQSWQGIGIDKDTGDGIIDYEVVDDGDKEVSVGDIIKLGYNTNLADNIIDENAYSFSITYIRNGEVIGSLGWNPNP